MSKIFFFCIYVLKYVILILLIFSKKKSLINCVLLGIDEVDCGDKKIIVEINKLKCF